MVSLFDNEQMTAYWKGHGFEEVILIDAKDFDDSDQDGAYVDSSRLTPPVHGVRVTRRAPRLSGPRLLPTFTNLTSW